MDDTSFCSKCSSVLIEQNTQVRESNECRACNLGVFGSCTCTYHYITVKELVCDVCERTCKKCNLVQDVNNLKNKMCESCINRIKQTNPSNEDKIYEYSEYNNCWYLVCRNEKCMKCSKNMMRDYGGSKICKECIIDNIKQRLGEIKSNNYEFDIELDKKAQFIKKNYRNKCGCDEFTDWKNISMYNDKYDEIIDEKENSCKKCNPSTLLLLYEYNINYNRWHLSQKGKECIICNKYIYISKSDKWSDIIQCDEHKAPTNEHIKFVKRNRGYNIDKIKFFHNGKHTWVKKNNNKFIKSTIKLDLDYKCDCTKCIK